ncbi:MAG: S8 family serine peptidase [Persicimonas sp.]
MVKESAVNLLRKAALPAAAFAMVIAAPVLASAQSADSSERELHEWQACLDGEQPSTENVEPWTSEVPAEQAMQLGASAAILDTDPTQDEIVLDFDDSLSDAEIEDFAAKHGLKVRLNSIYSDETNVYVATVDEGAVPYVKDCLTAKAPSGWIEGAEENIEYFALGTPAAQAGDDTADTAPNDPLYQFQWNFKQVNAEKAWKTSTGRDVTVAVIDTGVAMENAPDRGITRPKDLDGTSSVDGYDFVDDDAFAWDGHGHGTHVAGTIAQTTNNEYGVAGLAYNSKIMPLRVLNSRGFGQVSDIADAVRFSADNGADVINMSLGGPLPSLVLSRAIKYANKKGVTVVAAAGNGGKRAPSYPAAYDGVIAVAATQFDKNTTFYSQWGKYVDIAAPGGNTRVDQNGDGRPDGVMQQTLKDGKTDEHDFVLYMGTSMASPHVAAGAALVISQGITHPDKVEQVLQESADDSLKDRYDDEKEFRERYGAGLMQTDKAVQKAVVDQGSWRFAGGLLLAMLALVGVRRKDLLGVAGGFKPSVLIVSALTASGLFFLPLFIGEAGMFSGLVSAISHPLAEMDLALLGAGAHQNPLLASFLIPLAALALFGSHRKLKFLASGLALGMAGFLLTESVILTSDVQWIPGMGMLDRIWLGLNGLISFALGYLSLKRY